MPKNKQRTPAQQPERQIGVPDLPGWAIHERPDPRPVLGSDDPAVWAAVESASAEHARRIEAWCRSVGYRDQAEWNAAKAAERKAERAAGREPAGRLYYRCPSGPDRGGECTHCGEQFGSWDEWRYDHLTADKECPG